MGLKNKLRSIIILRAALLLNLVGAAFYAVLIFLFKGVVIEKMLSDEDTQELAIAITTIFLLKHLPNAI